MRAALRLADQYGHSRSARLGRPVDRNGMALPWLTYPAIEYLEQLDLSKRRVFEFGCGNSTFFWAQRVEAVHSVEHNREWYDLISADAPGNCQLTYAPTEKEYLEVLGKDGRRWDLIVIDGILRTKCAATVFLSLAPGGMIILDNSDWYADLAAYLRSTSLLQIDFSGFGPVNDYAWTTSIFFDRNFAIPPRTGRQPIVSRGGLDVSAE